MGEGLRAAVRVQGAAGGSVGGASVQASIRRFRFCIMGFRRFDWWFGV